MAPIIGIDLGTTNSLCAVFQDGQPRLITNVHGNLITPSIVGMMEDGSILVGDAAKELRVNHPEQCAWLFKRLMGTNRQVEIGGRKFEAPELSSLVLRSLKEDAEKDLGTNVTAAVITVPAYFNDSQRKATKLAGELAGLKVHRVINEPTAAALTYGFHDRDTEKKLIVVDLGGGTFDVTTMEVFEGTLEIISTAGDSFLGGEDFTSRIMAWALESQGMQLETAELKHPLLVSRLRQECESAKQQLFDNEQASIHFPNLHGEIEKSRPTLSLASTDFSTMVDPLVKRLARPIAKAIRDARHPPEEFSEVILVGGATRMEVVRSYFQKYFGTEPMCTFNPDEVVALGAAVQAALIQDDNAVDDMVMTDVCPFTLGVEICKEFGRRRTDGFYQPIIHRNTTIPVSREEVLYTVEPNQRQVQINVYQGESRKVKDNLFLGELKVSGIPPGPSGQPVHIRFTYDLNGILEAEAFVPDTGKKFSTVLTQHVKDLSRKKIQDAVRRMQELKFYPRDDIHNQHLVLFAERVIGEVSPFERDGLEAVIDGFERAMASGDREQFQFAREDLLMTLSRLDFPYLEEEHQ